MQIGAMNHPQQDVGAEVRRFRELGFDFIDLTLEPPQALPAGLDVGAVAAALAATGLGVVGHTAWYLPLATPYDGVREAAFAELARCFATFATLGARLVNLHPDARVPSLFPRDWTIERNVDSLRRLTERARSAGVQLMLENVPGLFNQVDVLTQVFNALPDLRWHLDVGHANLGGGPNATDRMLAAFGDRLAHVHCSDNKGGDADLHLPLGAGTIDWPAAVAALQRHGYDGTITLEVFSLDQDYLALSRQKLRRLWDGT
jgi:sugar phosphate isomerase/epimerase